MLIGPDRQQRLNGRKLRGTRPVINVSWRDAKSYVTWLSAKTGRNYRLLSETEREYVARAGSTTSFWWGAAITPEQANYNSRRTLPILNFKPNPWGLYQVHGNVDEWTQDCWNPDNAGNPGDGGARNSGDCARRVLRGGNWDNDPSSLRSAARFGAADDARSTAVGFRVARTLAP